MKKIGLLMVGLLVFGQAEFKRGDNNLTVIDTDTQLEWQDNSDSPSNYWYESINYCENLELDNKNDWRLPNINELKSIVIETQYAPTIATGNDKFKFTKSSNYWSSTTNKKDTRYSWRISFSNGNISFLYTGDHYYTSYVRCVRDAEN